MKQEYARAYAVVPESKDVKKKQSPKSQTRLTVATSRNNIPFNSEKT